VVVIAVTAIIYHEKDAVKRFPQLFCPGRSMNLHRRHLEYSQRAALAALEIERLQETGEVKAGRPSPTNSREIALITGKAAEIVAPVFRVGSRAAEEAVAVRRAAPDVFEVLKDGGINLRHAQREVDRRARELR